MVNQFLDVETGGGKVDLTPYAKKTDLSIYQKIISTQDLNMNGFTVKNLVEPVDGSDASRKVDIDAVYTNPTFITRINTPVIKGVASQLDIVIGNSGIGNPKIRFDGNAMNFLNAYGLNLNGSIIYEINVHNTMTTSSGFGVFIDTVNKLQITDTYINLNNETNMNNNKIIGLGNPTNAQDSATKGYVDTKTSSSLTKLSRMATSKWFTISKVKESGQYSGTTSRRLIIHENSLFKSFLGNDSSNNLKRLNTDLTETLSYSPVGVVHSVAFTPTKIWTVHSVDNIVIFGKTLGGIITTLSFGEAVHGLCYNGEHVVVTCPTTNNIRTFDTVTYNQISVYNSLSKPKQLYQGKSGFVFVFWEFGVSYFYNNSILNSFTLPTNYTLGDACFDGNEIFFTITNSNTMYAWNPITDTDRSWATGNSPVGICITGEYICIAINTAIELRNTATGSIIESITYPVTPLYLATDMVNIFVDWFDGTTTKL